MVSVKMNTEVIDLLLKRFTMQREIPVWMVRSAGPREAFLCGTIPDLPGGTLIRLSLGGGLTLMSELPREAPREKSEKRLGDLAAALGPYIR